MEISHLLLAMQRTCMGLLSLTVGGVLWAQAPLSTPSHEAELLTIEGTVQVYPLNGAGWISARTNQLLHLGDRLRTAQHSRATVLLSDLSVLRVNELTSLQIRPPQQSGTQSLLDVNSGAAYFLGRERPAKQEFRTPLSSGAIRGTEFNLEVAEDGRTVLTLLDGSVALSNQLGQLEMASGEQATVEPGKAPVKSPMVEAINIIQWCLYYPGVLDVDELQLSKEENQDLAASLSAYRAGDLLAAVAQYPAGRTGVSDSETVYHAALVLSAGQVDEAQGLLARFKSSATETNRGAKLGVALREVIAAIKNQPGPRAAPPRLATEWLAESYYFQARAQLRYALETARSAVEQSPQFGFGWARVAELELGFGRLDRAKEALEKSLQLSPRNAQSLAVKGFIELAQGRGEAARTSFDQAIAVDGALGNAWLGRGLCQIRHGNVEAGRRDLQVAAVLEPQRAVLRSYLGKAFSATGDDPRARKELALAQRIDPNDPTAWLYDALIEQRDNEINPAVRDLEKSEELNDNRRLFRSRLLLDEDQAVRAAHLARVYQDTGFYTWDKDAAWSDWSVREASRAVNYDYANFSAHQFLADSYDALRDPRQINLRYETPWFDELIMANLLSPAAAGNLSEFSLQRQYSPLFEQNHFGASSDTEYLSHGDWLERGSQYGTWDDVTYAADVEYRSDRGWRVNNDLQQFTGSAKAKAQLTPQDSVFVEGVYYHSTFGDLNQYYNQYGNTTGVRPAPSPEFRGKEWQEPNVFLGYHHEWTPGSHTLFLGGYLNDRLEYNDPLAKILFTANSFGSLFVTNFSFPVTYEREFEAFTAELQQVYQTQCQTFVAGTRYQNGWNTTTSKVVDNTFNTPPLVVSDQELDTSLERFSIYGYETIKPLEPLELSGGIAYDWLRFPANIDTSPITSSEREIDQISPKAGLIWTITPETHFRFAYTRSLGGFSYDNSVRLEPTQVAGFNQAFRSIIPESVVGIVPGSRFTTYGVGLDRSFKSHTYLTVEGEILDSEADRTVGVVTNTGIVFPIPRGGGSVSQSLDYTEQSLVVSLSQLLCEDWSLGGRYRLSHAELNSRFPDLLPNQDLSARFQQLVLYLNYYHPCGFFGQLEGLWTDQSNHGYSPSLAPADFWQFNAYAGYRFLRRAAEVKLGLLNMTDRDYRLNPLNLYYDLPRGRTLAVSFKFYF